MSAAPDDIDYMVWLAAVARLVGLQIPDAYKEGVLLNLRVIAGHAERLGDFVLDDHIEPAPVYRA